MGEYNNSNDILRRLRGRNPYVPSTAIANLPILGLPITHNPTTTNNSINTTTGPPPPLIINYPLEILRLDGKTKSERVRSTDLKCQSDPYSIMSELKNLLRKEKIMANIDSFVFGYCQTPTGKTKSIYDYKINDIDFEKFSHFTLQQVQEPETESTTTTNSSPSKNNNKKRYAHCNNSMTEAEADLRKELDTTSWQALRRNRKLFAKYKYKIGVEGKSFDDIEDELYDDLEPLLRKKKKRHRKYYSDDSDSESDGYQPRHKKRKTSHHRRQSNQMDEMMDMMKMKIMMSMVGDGTVKAKPEPVPAAAPVKPEAVKTDPAVKPESPVKPEKMPISLPIIANMPNQIAPDPNTLKPSTKPGLFTITMNNI